MIDEFLLRAGLAGVGLTLATGPLGCFVVWRRMAYFGDATAHAAVLGVALSFAIGAPIYLGIPLIALTMALTMTALSNRGQNSDTILGVLAHSALAFGWVAASFITALRVNLESWLFGDILFVEWADVWVIWGGAVLVLGLLIWRWQALLTATLNEELAQASGLSPRREGLILTLALALTVAMAIKVVGALLVAALLIIPAATARRFARTPEVMAALSVVLSIVTVILGLGLSLRFDTPAGPSIVASGALIFLGAVLARR